MFYFIVLILFLLVLFFIYKSIVANENPINTALAFNVCALLYFPIGLTLYVENIQGGWASDELYEVLYSAVIAILGFNVSYFYNLSKKTYVWTHKNFEIPTRETLIFILMFGFGFEAFAILKVGVYNFFFISRLDRFPLLKENQAYFFLANVVNIALVFSRAKYSSTGDARDLRLFRVILCHNILMAVLLISRSMLVFNGVVLAYFWLKDGLISKKLFLLTSLFVLLTLFFYKPVLYGLILDKQMESYFNYSEFINWIRNSMLLMKLGVTAGDFTDNSYAMTFLSIVHPSPPGMPLSEWFIKWFHEDSFVAGLTYGFSGLLEPFMYFGYVGVFVQYSVVGFLFSFLQKRKAVLFAFCNIVAVCLMFRLFRSESYNFVKTFFWYYLYQALFIFLVDIVIRKTANYKTYFRKL